MATIGIISLVDLPTTAAPASRYDGSVQRGEVFDTAEPPHVAVRSLAFQPSARTHLRTHSLGELLVITRGSGLIQQTGRALTPVRQGDVVWTPPGIEYWHGAGKDGPSLHIAVLKDERNGAVAPSANSAAHTAQSASAAQPDEQSALRVYRSATLPTNSDHSAHFTGAVHLTPLLTAPHPVDMAVMSVTFECCARSDWHSHPLGQLLIVTEGSGLVQQRGQRVRRIEVGDVVWTPPGVENWHGAGIHGAMTHVAIVWSKDGSIVDWKEAVSDAEHGAAPQPR